MCILPLYVDDTSLVMSEFKAPTFFGANIEFHNPLFISRQGRNVDRVRQVLTSHTLMEIYRRRHTPQMTSYSVFYIFLNLY